MNLSLLPTQGSRHCNGLSPVPQLQLLHSTRPLCCHRLTECWGFMCCTESPPGWRLGVGGQAVSRAYASPTLSWKEEYSDSPLFLHRGPWEVREDACEALLGVLGGAEEGATGAKCPQRTTHARPDSTRLLPPPPSTLSPQEVIKM